MDRLEDQLPRRQFPQTREADLEARRTVQQGTHM